MHYYAKIIFWGIAYIAFVHMHACYVAWILASLIKMHLFSNKNPRVCASLPVFSSLFT